MRRINQSSSRKSSASPRNRVWQRCTCAWMRPGMTRQPLQSRTWGWGRGPFPLPSSLFLAFPIASILPSRTVTSARSTRQAPSCRSTSPPASRKSGTSGPAASGSGPRRGAGRVVGEVEVGAQLVHQIAVLVHARQDPLGAARIDQEIAVGIVQARQENGAPRGVGERDVDRVGVGGDELDAAGREGGCHLRRVVLQVVERVGLVVPAERVRRAQQNSPTVGGVITRGATSALSVEPWGTSWARSTESLCWAILASDRVRHAATQRSATSAPIRMGGNIFHLLEQRSTRRAECVG